MHAKTMVIGRSSAHHSDEFLAIDLNTRSKEVYQKHTTVVLGMAMQAHGLYFFNS